jgi:hypothetical protein
MDLDNIIADYRNLKARIMPMLEEYEAAHASDEPEEAPADAPAQEPPPPPAEPPPPPPPPGPGRPGAAA